MFVQVIQGQVTDVDKAREIDRAMEDALMRYGSPTGLHRLFLDSSTGR